MKIKRLQRTNYFTGMLLSAEALQREQEYHLERHRRQNRYLHGWGVVSGLGVSIEAGAIVVSPGLAIDCAGNELVVDLSAQILFDSGGAEVNEAGQKVLAEVGRSLSALKDYTIQVGGHTDHQRVTNPETQERFPTNWELSTARATNVVRFLEERGKIPGTRLVATGFNQFRPVAGNTTEEGRQKNRRIELMRDLTDDDVRDVLRRGIKRRRESVEMYEKGGRNDLVEKERAEIAALEKYLPANVGDDEIRDAVRLAIGAGANTIGALMGAVMPRFKGRAEGATINRIAREELSRQA